MVGVCLAPVAAALGRAAGSAHLASGQRADGPPARGRPASVVVTGLATWAVLGGTSLAREAQAIGRL
jgi:adenosylcobinamide-phosphate synthase